MRSAPDKLSNGNGDESLGRYPDQIVTRMPSLFFRLEFATVAPHAAKAETRYNGRKVITSIA